MSKSSERVKKWRKNTKNKLVAALGGKCRVCGYSKCTQALALHHINPAEKEFNFSSLRASPKTWSKIVAEAKKCVLLCHNCHMEVHDGMLDITGMEIIFNDVFQGTQVVWGQAVNLDVVGSIPTPGANMQS